ncbi:MAG: bifunctional hydroxymethylpyrimidine kinase/phosphomethylpyrimidine kinase [Tissierellia bacterium]|nr:bifunctional hydroxymethylpyrimidine kinase/phosphomethylpyrimidine kinase [Tissierellia bacterium]
MKEKILLVSDLAGYGKVALGASMPILAHMGYELFNLPTALVSNTLDYGDFYILPTTDYMKETLQVWDRLGFSFDAISLGFMVSKDQVDLLRDYCQTKRAQGVQVFLDPIMADEGQLYNGMTQTTVDLMKSLAREADYLVPNYTEACLLAGLAYCQEGLDWVGARALIRALKDLSPGSFIISSCLLEGQSVNLVYNRKTGQTTALPFDPVPLRFAGTGDIFNAYLTGRVLSGVPLEEAVQGAADFVLKLICAQDEDAQAYKGLALEGHLHSLIQP